MQIQNKVPSTLSRLSKSYVTIHKKNGCPSHKQQATQYVFSWQYGSTI